MGKRTHVIIPDELVRDIDTLVGKRQRSKFIVQAASRELHRQRQLAALQMAAGCWKNSDHPELKEGAAAWVKDLRKADELRFQRQTGQGR